MSFGQIIVALIRGASCVVGYVASTVFEDGIYKAAGVEEEEELIAVIDHRHQLRLADKKRKAEEK